jgi:hypothetical protein
MPTFRPGNALFVHFLQGGGATFWQAKNGGFWGPRGSRAGHVETIFRSRFSERKIPVVLPRHKNRTMHLRIAPPNIKNFWHEVFFERIYSYRNGYRHVIDIRSLPKGRSLFYIIF